MIFTDKMGNCGTARTVAIIARKGRMALTVMLDDSRAVKAEAIEVFVRI